MKEEAARFGKLGSLIGIVTAAAPAEVDKPGVILLNPGIVHRVGPGRIYVKIARALAAQGFTVLRFDFSGIGDSSARPDNLRFEESSIDEACAAMSFLETTRDINRFILLGGCSGAAVALETARSDRRAIGTILINFPARADEDEQALYSKDRHYYWNFAILNLKSWGKLLTGRSDYGKIGRALTQGLMRVFIDRKSASDSDQRFRRILQESAGLGVQLTFICSKGDPLLRELREAGGVELKRLCAQGKVTCDVIPQSDHTFSSLYDQKRLVDAILRRVHAASIRTQPLAQASAIPSSPVEALFQRR